MSTAPKITSYDVIFEYFLRKNHKVPPKSKLYILRHFCRTCRQKWFLMRLHLKLLQEYSRQNHNGFVSNLNIYNMIFDNISEVNIRIKSKNFSGYLFFIKNFSKRYWQIGKMCYNTNHSNSIGKEKKGKCDMITQNLKYVQNGRMCCCCCN